MADTKVRIVIVDDHAMMRQLIKAILQKRGDVEIVGEAEDGQSALEVIGLTAPDLAILDVAIPRLNGIETTARLGVLEPNTKVLMVSVYTEPTLVRQALNSGARGYLAKGEMGQELLPAIEAVQEGGTFLSPSIATRLR